MLAAAESNFFASTPIIAHQISRAAAVQPIDLLVAGFTLTGVSLLLSEHFEIPVANFCLQPTCIPSSDREWNPVVHIASHNLLSFIDEVEIHAFTKHQTLQPLKRLAERNPFAALSLPRLRAAFGLPSSADTWRVIFEQVCHLGASRRIAARRPLGWRTITLTRHLYTPHTRATCPRHMHKCHMHMPYSRVTLAWIPACTCQELPVVVPMHQDAFSKPADFPPSIATTDFIFLRPTLPKLHQAVPAPAPAPASAVALAAAAEAGGGVAQEVAGSATAEEATAAPALPERSRALSSLGQLAGDVTRFIEEARAAERRLVVMTFSSMPIPRAKMLARACKMIGSCIYPLSLVYALMPLPAHPSRALDNGYPLIMPSWACTYAYMSRRYVGKRQPDRVRRQLLRRVESFKATGRLLEVSACDFGLLFPKMDAFIVHGGLGTTVEAMRMRRPVCVTGILLFDQRFWGAVCERKGIGPPPVHIDHFIETCAAAYASPWPWQPRARPCSHPRARICSRSCACARPYLQYAHGHTNAGAHAIA